MVITKYEQNRLLIKRFIQSVGKKSSDDVWLLTIFTEIMFFFPLKRTVGASDADKDF